MKKFIFLLTLLITTSAFAQNPARPELDTNEKRRMTSPPRGLANLQNDVAVARGRFGAIPNPLELTIILNEVAWKNKDTGWGLSLKPAGNNCPAPQGPVACDILYNRNENILVDVLASAGVEARPTWQVLGPNTDASRPWVAPVCVRDCNGPKPDPVEPKPDPDPAPDHRLLMLRIISLLERIEENQTKQGVALEKGLQDLKAEIAKGIKIRW